MRSRITLAGLLLGLTAALGSGQGTNLQVLETPFYPLKPGNTWTYKSGDEKVVVRVDKLDVVEAKIEGKNEKIPAHRIVISGKDGRETSEYIAVLADGVYRFVGDARTNPPLRFFKLPLKKGETWQVNGTLEGMAVKGTFTANEAEITVPAGTYKTMTVAAGDVQIGTQKMSLEYWFAPNVGIVKQWIKLGTYERTLEMEGFKQK